MEAAFFGLLGVGCFSEPGSLKSSPVSLLRYKKNLKALYVVHPTSFIKVLWNILKPLIRCAGLWERTPLGLEVPQCPWDGLPYPHATEGPSPGCLWIWGSPPTWGSLGVHKAGPGHGQECWPLTPVGFAPGV